MKLLTWKLELPEGGLGSTERGQQGEEAQVTAYLLDWGEDGSRKPRPGVIICPGGAYSHLSQREGEPVAMEYLAMGYHAFVLRYTVAPGRFPTALRQLALLVAQIREHSREWEVDPEKIVVSGFSAGGHLACSLGALWNREFVYEGIGQKGEDIRPDGMILCYPVVTAGAWCHAGSIENLLGREAENQEARQLVSLEKQVGPHTPRTFMWHTVTDGTVPVQNSMALAEALISSGVSLELHLFPSGIHGLSLAREDTSKGQKELIEPRCQSWIRLAGEWMKGL